MSWLQFFYLFLFKDTSDRLNVPPNIPEQQPTADQQS